MNVQHRSFNVQHRILNLKRLLNESKTQYRIVSVSSSFQIQNSMLDVGCSMFIRSPVLINLALYEILIFEFFG